MMIFFDIRYFIFKRPLFLNTFKRWTSSLVEQEKEVESWMRKRDMDRRLQQKVTFFFFLFFFFFSPLINCNCNF